MKKIVEVAVKPVTKIVEEEGGLLTLLGKRVFFHCVNYHYSGTLTGVNETQIELSNAEVVFETGPYADMAKRFKISEKLPMKLYLRLSAIESYFELS